MSTVVQTKSPVPTDAEDRSAPLVSVVIPCLNEAQNIEACVTVALQALKRMGVRGEVVVADNDSEDDSARLASEAGLDPAGDGAKYAGDFRSRIILESGVIGIEFEIEHCGSCFLQLKFPPSPS